jgi:hypothetical protein
MFNPVEATPEELVAHFYSFDDETRDDVIHFNAQKPWMRQVRVARHLHQGDVVFAGDITRFCELCRKPFSPFGSGKPGNQRFCGPDCARRNTALHNPHLFRKGEARAKRKAETKEERIARLREEINKLEERVAKDKHPLGK